jgi:hypothetical protein
MKFRIILYYSWGDNFINLRIKYIMKEISFDDWKRELNALRKKNEKNILDIF